jgi:hypothetical protein
MVCTRYPPGSTHGSYSPMPLCELAFMSGFVAVPSQLFGTGSPSPGEWRLCVVGAGQVMPPIVLLARDAVPITACSFVRRLQDISLTNTG